MRQSGFLFLAVALAALMVLPACSKKEAPPVEQEIAPVEEIVPPPPPPPVVEEPAVKELEPIVLQDVFFDYDKFSIRNEFKKVLEANAELLLAREGAKLHIEGHCDERGTNEYNLALGEKRAKAVMDFYVAYGVPAARLSMISYGEERPFDRGHDEAAWAKNRRAHMVVKE
ncbi:MAG: peptidoglycan-associated lipoprotein Pal [Candidatus Krumholzibacteria bacterium]|nr:peptidoglycan-associated lipoprotein Pal [Candidatus Krumholzibacteria bacterium]